MFFSWGKTQKLSNVVSSTFWYSHCLYQWAIFCSLKLLNLLAAIFLLNKTTQSHPQLFSVNGSIICSGLHFWRHFDVIGSIICSGLHFWRHWFNMTKFLSKFGEQQLAIVNYACGFNQSETGKYFEWIIIVNYVTCFHKSWICTFCGTLRCSLT